MVTGEDGEGLLFPAPVLEDLGRQFDEVPGDTDAGEGFDFDFAEEVMEQVSELVEDRGDLVVVEQRLLAGDGRREVAAHQAEVRGERAVGTRAAGAEEVHPRPTPLRLAREPIGVERAQQTVAIAHLVEADLGVPDADRGAVDARFGGADDRLGAGGLVDVIGVAGDDLDAEEPAEEAEHAGDHAVDREPRAQGLVVEIILLATHLLGPVAELPRVQRTQRVAGLGGAVVLELDAFGLELRADALADVLDELQGRVARAGHTAGRREIGEVLLAEEAGLLVTEREDLTDQRCVVPGVLQADLAEAFPALATQVFVIGILQHREDRRRLQREAPGLRLALRGRGLLRRGERAGGQAGEALFVVDEELPGVGGIEDVLGILLRLLREVGVELRQASLPFRGQVGAVLFEISDRLLEEAAADARERLGVGGRRVGLEHRPEFRVERQRGEERGDLGHHRVVGLAELGRVEDRVQVRDQAPGAGEVLGRGFESQEHLGVGQVGALRVLERVDVGAGAAQGLADIRLDVFGLQAAPVEKELVGEEGVHADSLREWGRISRQPYGRKQRGLAGRRRRAHFAA